MMSKAIFYGRFSPRPKGADEGPCDSIKVQRSRVEDYARAHGLEILEGGQDEYLSGKAQANRPGLKAAIRLACDEKAPLIVYSLSRLARSTKDAIEITDKLRECGSGLISISEQIDTTTPTGKFFFTVLAALAQFERELTAERTRDAMKAHQDAGRRMSRYTPWGWKLDPHNNRRMIPNHDELAAKELACRLRRQGMSLQKIATELTRKHTPRGKKFYARTVVDLTK